MPQAAYSVRKPTPLKKGNRKRRTVEIAEPEDSMCGKFSPHYTLKTLSAVSGRLANYYIRVFARQYASMQGLLVDAADNETYAFRSELELIRYLRDLLNDKLR